MKRVYHQHQGQFFIINVNVFSRAVNTMAQMAGFFLFLNTTVNAKEDENTKSIALCQSSQDLKKH